MNHTRRRRAASARVSIWTRLRQRLFRRRRPKTVAVPSTWLIDRKRAMIGDDLDQEMDISEQETLILPRVEMPAYAYWFYADETTLEPALK